MIFNSIKSGFGQVLQNKRMVLVFFLTNFFFALLIMLPFRGALSSYIGSSAMGATLGGRLNMDFLYEFILNQRGALSAAASLILVVPLVYWLMNLFLSGGAFAVFASGEKYQPVKFWGGSAAYFGRFFRLFLWAIPVFAILFCLQFLVTAGVKIFFGSDPYQNIAFWAGWTKVGFRYLSILLFWLVLDYARIYTVIHDERKMRLSIWHGIRFSFSHLAQTFGLAFLLFVAGIIVLIIYNPLANLFSVPNSLIILLLFVLQQVYMVFRMILRLTLYAGQMNLFRQLSAQKDTTGDDFQPEAELGNAQIAT